MYKMLKYNVIVYFKYVNYLSLAYDKQCFCNKKHLEHVLPFESVSEYKLVQVEAGFIKLFYHVSRSWIDETILSTVEAG